jgi:transcriptional regulator with GAF, ATPase, and Fis domain
MANTIVPTEPTPDRLGVLHTRGSAADAIQTETEPDGTVGSPSATHGRQADATWVARTLIELTDTVESDVGLQSLGVLLATRYAELVGDIEMGILLNDHTGGLHEAYASTERMQVLQSFEIGYLDGPAIDCALSGMATVNLRLEDTDEMWPRVVPLARSMGYRTLHVLPLRLRDQTIGTIELCDVDDRVVPAATLELGQALADSVTIGILHDRAVCRYVALSEQLQTALNTRVLIEQAKGVMSERLGVDMDEAFALLRCFARSHNLVLTSAAQAAIDGAITSAELGGSLGHLSSRKVSARGRS